MKALLILLLSAPASAQFIGGPSNINSPASSAASGATAGQDIDGDDGVFKTLRATSTTHGLTVEAASTFKGSMTVSGNLGNDSGSLKLGSGATVSSFSATGELLMAGGAQVKLSSAQLNISGNVAVPFQITSALNRSSISVTNVAAAGGGVALKINHSGAALTDVAGATCMFNDVDAANRGNCWFRMAYGDGYDRFGIYLVGDDLRTTILTAGGSSLNDTSSGGRIGIWTGSSAAQKHMFNESGRLGLNVVTTNPKATLEVVNSVYQADYAVIISSQDTSTKILAIDKFGHFSSSAAVNASLGTCTNGTLKQPSNDRAGIVTFAGANTSCALVFANAYPTAGNTVCTFGAKMATPAAMSVTVTNTGFTAVATAFANTDEFHYLCEFVGM